MPSSARPDGRSCPAREEVNVQLRVLMTQPASDARTEEWLRLLTRWVDGCHDCQGCDWTTAA